MLEITGPLQAPPRAPVGGAPWDSDTRGFRSPCPSRLRPPGPLPGARHSGGPPEGDTFKSPQGCGTRSLSRGVGEAAEARGGRVSWGGGPSPGPSECSLRSPLPAGRPWDVPGQQGRAAQPSRLQTAGPSGPVAARSLCRGDRRLRGTGWPRDMARAPGCWPPPRAPTATLRPPPPHVFPGAWGDLGEEGLGSLGITRSGSDKPGGSGPVPGLTPKR